MFGQGEEEYGCHAFDTLLTKVREQVSGESLKEFSSLHSNEERFSYIMGLDELEGLLDDEPCLTSKCSDDARDQRLLGNKLFEGMQYQAALHRYNQSIRLAPVQDGDQELALALANRSAVLMHIKSYKLSIRDAEWALNQGYPEDMQFKLYDRIGKCMSKLGNRDEALIAFDRAIELIDSSNLEEEEKQLWFGSIHKRRGDALEIAPSGGVPLWQNGRILAGEAGVPMLTSANSELFPSASTAFDVKCDPEVGRHVIAGEDVRVGDVVLVEKPYASVLYPTFRLTHCYHCFRQFGLVFPCRRCTSVVYCSEKCASNSWDKYHYAECGLVGQLAMSAGCIGHLALRVATTAGLRKLLQHDPVTDNTETWPKLNKISCYKTDYAAVHALMGHSAHRSAAVLLEFSAMAYYLALVLQKNGFFNNNADQLSLNGNSELEDVDEDSFAKLGTALLHVLQVVQCNAIGVTEMRNSNDFSNCKPCDLGLAVYTTAALTNHSCNPAVDFNFYGNACVFRAMKDIPMGEEINADYGIVYSTHSLEERQATLHAQYFFRCQCDACANKWPTWQDIEAKRPTFKCDTCNKVLPQGGNKKGITTCPCCGAKHSVNHILRELQASHANYSKAMAAIGRGDLRGALPALQGHLHLLQRWIAPPWREFVNCQATIKQCYRILGNNDSTGCFQY